MDSQLLVTVTGSLEFPTLSSRRDADSIYRPSTLRDCCDTAWSLPLLCRTDGVAMDAAGFSIVDNRAGTPRRWRQISQRKALCRYMMFRTCSGCVVAAKVRQRVAFCSGSVWVLVPDCRGLEQNFHDITVVDMGDLSEKMASGGVSTHEVVTARAGGNATGGKTTIPEEAAGAM